MRYHEILREYFLKESGFEKLNGLTVQSLDTFLHQEEDEDGEEQIKEASGDKDEFGLGAKFRTMDEPEVQGLLGRSKLKQKTKRDKFDYPYVHGSNIEIKDEAGKEFDSDRLKQAIMQRPKNLLKQNEKMMHSDGTSSIFYNIGLPALKGLAVNEKTNEFVVVDTCPGAGACKIFCYAMKGGYVQWKASSMAQTRVLNFLLNDPKGFAEALCEEIAKAEKKNAKSKTKVVIRWHDAGDFFSQEYLTVAYEVAKQFPQIDFYAYTKMADVAKADRPRNFKMNFSSGALFKQERQIDFHKVKHSRVVPKELFYDLIAREGNTLIKDAKGRMQFAGLNELEEFKQRLAKKFNVDPSTLITYDQMMSIKETDEPRYNVMVMPGDGDDGANRNDILGSFLLIH